MTQQNAIKVVLCVCTYRRPAGLKKLLDNLPALHGADDLQVVVSDNDAAGEGIAICQGMPSDYPFTIHTVTESTPGISAARNTATAKALSLSPELIAFLDDDEWPEPQWLSELIRVQKKHSADVVGGPTRPEFPEHADPALLANPYYGADMALPDESRCQLQAGGNFLMRASVLSPLAPEFFRPEFAHSGGEDLAFFMQLAQLDHSMYWAANAVVHEPVPESRLHPNWLKHRVVTVHNSRVRVMQLLQPDLPATLVRCTKTVGLGVVAGLLSLTSMIVPSLKDKATQLRWKFEGKLTAHLGRTTLRSETY